MIAAVIALVFAASARTAGDDRAATQPASRPAVAPLTLADASEAERLLMDRFLKAPSWPRRAIACLRLERYGCPASQARLVALLRDPDWTVRAFAVRALARQCVPAGESWFTNETEPRVLRTILRYRYTPDASRLDRGVRALVKSSDLDDKMLAAEIGGASGDSKLVALAAETAKIVILRMDRAEAGEFSPRLAALTGAPDFRRPLDWQQWLLKKGRRFELRPVFLIAAPPAENSSSSLMSQMDAEAFAGVETYMTKLQDHDLDLAVCIDCTASMGRALSEAQGGADDLMQFVGGVMQSVRLAVVGYRDRRDDFETRAWDFTGDVDEARKALWQLTADGGGDHRESVHAALKRAFTELSWRPTTTKVLVLIGDAPPHVGEGELSIRLAERARESADLTTHVIQARGKPVEHFPEIAKAGGGRCVGLAEGDSLVAQIAGLTLGDQYEDEFREFFQIYLELCR